MTDLLVFALIALAAALAMYAHLERRAARRARRRLDEPPVTIHGFIPGKPLPWQKPAPPRPSIDPLEVPHP